MNNSFLLGYEQEKDHEPDTRLSEREAEVVRILEALTVLSKRNEWSTLKTYIFDGLTDRLSKDLISEARQNSPDTEKLAKITGQLMWAERYSNLDTLISQFRGELKNIRIRLYGKSEKQG